MNEIDNILDSAYCRCIYNKEEKAEKHLYRWKSWEGNTPFAPVYDVPIWLDDIDSSLSEPLVQCMVENNHGNYRQYWKEYNIFKWEYPCLKSLREEIYRIYKDYMEALHLQPELPESLWIKGWAVCLEEGEEIEQHCHAYHENAYLSANISFASGTTTDYVIPHLSSYYGFWRCQNKKGRVSMFPSWVEHSVERVKERRYSIGLDIFDFNTMDYISNNRDPNNNEQNTILEAIQLA
tara:strand:- start:124 stop:831 length:708 start_codon:yes stop_codon:yes gene_type:complete